MESNAHAGVSHPFGGPHRNISRDAKRTYVQLFGYKVQPLNIKVTSGEEGERMYGKDIPCSDRKISIKELQNKYKDISPFIYSPAALENVSKAQANIDLASKATGVPEMAIAAALADENTARGAKVAGILDAGQDIAAYIAGNLQDIRTDYAEAVRKGVLHGDRNGRLYDYTTHDIGPANINVATALNIFDENIINSNSENHINKFLYKIVSKNAPDEKKWEAYKDNMLLTIDGSAHLAAAEMQKGAVMLAPYMSNSTKEEQVAILVTHYKQGTKYLRKYLQSPHRGTRDIRAGEGARIFHNWDALINALGY